MPTLGEAWIAEMASDDREIPSSRAKGSGDGDREIADLA